MFEPTGELRIVFRRKQSGKTYMADQYYRLPLQVLPPYYPDADGTAFVYLLNPTGGVLQKDRLLTDILVEPGARALVTTTAANKYYRMEDGHAEIANRMEVREGGVLEYLPDYGIPYAGTRLFQENVFHLDRTATLITSDMIIPGRVDRGEVFAYDIYASKIKIYVDGRLEAYEHARMEPKQGDLRALCLLEGHSVYGSMYIYQENLPASLAEEIRSFFGGSVRGGVSFVTGSLACVRLLSDSVSEMEEVIMSVWGAARRHLLAKDRVKIRKY